MSNLSRLFTVFILIHYNGADISITKNSKPTGSISPGFVSQEPHASLNQGSSAKIQVSDMSSLTMERDSELTQKETCWFEFGNFSRVAFHQNCKATFESYSKILQRFTYGIGYTEVHCDATWLQGKDSTVYTHPQSLFNMTYDLSIGANVQLYIKSHCNLQVHGAFVLEDQVSFTMEPHSFFIVDKGATATISSPLKGDLTTVILGPSSRIQVSGLLELGHGTAADIQLFESGNIIVGQGGVFQIESSNFIVGPSSYWIIDGSFKVLGNAFLISELQSNITIFHKGSLQMSTAGSIQVHAGATMFIGGTLSMEGSTLSLASSSQVNIGSNGMIKMTSANSVTIAPFGGLSIDIAANLLFDPKASVSIGDRSLIEVLTGHFCTVNGIVVIPPVTRITLPTDQAKLNGSVRCF